jgi:hypothetical protein
LNYEYAQQPIHLAVSAAVVHQRPESPALQL